MSTKKSPRERAQEFWSEIVYFFFAALDVLWVILYILSWPFKMLWQVFCWIIVGIFRIFHAIFSNIWLFIGSIFEGIADSFNN